MAKYLEPVSQKFTGDNSDLIAKIEEIKAAEKGLADTSAKTSDAITEDNKEVGKGFEDLGAKAKKSGDDIDTSLKDSGKASSDFERLVTANLKDGESAFDSLKQAVEDTKTKIVDLRSSFASTGSAGVFGDLRKSENDLKSLEGYLKEMTPEIGNVGASAGNNFFKQFTSQFGDADIGGKIKPAIIGGVILAAPAIISILGAAVETGVGAAGIAAGIYEAAKDPRVSAAAKGLGSELSHELSSATASFVGPTLVGIDTLKGAFAGIEPGLKSTFADLSKDVQPLAQGLGAAADKFLPGLEKGLKGASPLLLELANDLPELGKQVGDMFAKFGSGGPGAVMALRGLIGIIGDVATGLGSVYDWSTKTFESMVQEIVHVENGFGDLFDALGKIPGNGSFTKIGQSLHDVADKQQNYIDSSKTAAGATSTFSASQDAAAKSTNKTVMSLNDLITANNKWLSSAESSDNATLSFHEALTAFDKELKAGKVNWNENTAAGQQTVSTFYQAVDALTSLNPTTEKGIEAAQKHAAALLKDAQASGATTAETKTLRTYVALLNDELAKVKSKSIKITIDEKYTTHFIDEGTSPSDFYHGLAKGGVVHAAQGLVSGILPARSPGTLILAGEPQTGGEVLAPLRGISQSRAMSLAQVIGDSYDFDVTNRTQQTAMLMGSGGGYGGTRYLQPIQVNLGPRQMAMFHVELIGPAQRYKSRTGTTGLT